MQTIQTLVNKNRNAKIQKDDLGYFKTTCLIEDQIAPAHPPKEYKTLAGAKKYANKFLRLAS